MTESNPNVEREMRDEHRKCAARGRVGDWWFAKAARALHWTPHGGGDDDCLGGDWWFSILHLVDTWPSQNKSSLSVYRTNGAVAIIFPV